MFIITAVFGIFLESCYNCVVYHDKKRVSSYHK